MARFFTDKGFSKRALVFGLCVLLSVFFWLLTSLNTDQTAKISIPVKFTGVPANLIIEGELKQTLEVEVKSKGFNLLQSSVLPYIEIPLSLPADVVQGKTSRYVVNLENYSSYISSQLGKSTQLIRVNPDSMLLVFKAFSVKKVPVQLHPSVNFKPNYGVAGEILQSVDSVLVSGPAEALTAISVLYTEIPAVAFYANVDRTFALDLPPDVKATPDAVKMVFPVGELTEEIIDLPILVLNLPDSLKVNLTPDRCQVKVSWPVRFSARKQKPDLRVTADLKHIREDWFRKVLLEVEDCPPYIRVKSITPQSVDFIFIQK